ncbi:MAG TPA: hypothetical protein VN884_01730 [Candidatus Sulfotelmatobacter sp.]|jgi:hypothetical protein|nr:hypothetical protein [Candidatus Sulfotelmatobacter sp.]
METSHLLKGEINQTLDSLHDFAKWKLIVTSALAGAGFGLTSNNQDKPHYWLLLFIPFACAYVDLNCYQYLIRIAVLARSLREHADDPLLRIYERECNELREKYGIFDLGKYAGVGASLAVSIVAPGFAVAAFSTTKDINFYVSIAVWVLGILLIVALWSFFKGKNKAADEGEIPDPTKTAPRRQR